MFAIIFISLYSVMGDDRDGFTTSESSPSFNFKLQSLDSDIDRDTIFTYISIFTIIILYISFSMGLTWPMRIEEALIIILIWSLLGNLGLPFINHNHHNHQKNHHCNEEFSIFFSICLDYAV